MARAARAAKAAQVDIGPGVTSPSNASAILQRFLNQDTLANYALASAEWARAQAEVARFDRELDSYSQRTGLRTANNQQLAALDANALTKSNRAAGTMAGEAAETRHWQVRAATHHATESINGPGGAVGVDLHTYQPVSASVSARHDHEVKTARTGGTLLDGIAAAHAAGTRNVTVHYRGAYQRPAGPFTRVGVIYNMDAFGSFAPNSAKVEVLDANTGAVHDRFSIH